MAKNKPLSNRLKNQVEPEPDEIEVDDDSLAGQLVAEKADFSTWFQERVKDAPWWGISLVVHLLAILIFGTIVMSQPILNVDIMGEIKLPFEQPKMLDMELPRDVVENKKLPKEIPSEQDPVWKNAEVSDHSETADDEDFQMSKGDSMEFVSDKPLKGMGVYDQLGVGGGAGGAYGGFRGGRRNLVSNGGGSMMTENAVTAGLAWLARHQNPDGSWGTISFQHQCEGTRCSGTGEPFFDIGLTGLASLAFTGATYSPSSKDVYAGICFGDVVRKAAFYLRDIQSEDGAFGLPTEGKFMYNHAVCTYALADLVALMKDKREAGVALFKNTTEKAVNFMLSAQNPGKAWRYRPKCGDNDASVTGWCAMALKAAEEGGLHVPKKVWTGIKSHLDDVTEEAYGRVGYVTRDSCAILGSEKALQESGNLYVPPSLTAIGIMMRIFMADRKNTLLKSGASLLLENLPAWDTSKVGKVDYYYWFYGSYCMNQYDGPKGPAWTQWNKAMQDVLLKHQKTSRDGCANGSWDPVDRWSHHGGRVYSTAISVLTLEVFYRLRIVMGK